MRAAVALLVVALAGCGAPSVGSTSTSILPPVASARPEPPAVRASPAADSTARAWSSTTAATSPPRVPDPSPSWNAAPIPTPGLLLAKRIESFYAQAAPFECDLDVETLVTARTTTQRSRVHVVFERAGRFHVAMPGGSFLLVDRGIQTLFDPMTSGLNQQSVAVGHCPVALSYAAGAGVLAQHLDMQAYAGVSMNAPGLEILVGSPLAPSPAINRVLFFADANGQVRRSLFVTPWGDRQRYDLVSCTQRIKPPPSLFVFSTPSFAGPAPPPPAPSFLLTSLP